ncbi:unnamed protein product [Pleuronectes platessa]|uniref:Uncharacterized protein n=1 Tax=Pleuronectes platessa TaxID=8262 RepID=A0A9N7YB19_PLEPL|nr:unnamed protein product [Pleuronectes platessa]
MNLMNNADVCAEPCSRVSVQLSNKEPVWKIQGVKATGLNQTAPAIPVPGHSLQREEARGVPASSHSLTRLDVQAAHLLPNAFLPPWLSQVRPADPSAVRPHSRGGRDTDPHRCGPADEQTITMADP